MGLRLTTPILFIGWFPQQQSYRHDLSDHLPTLLSQRHKLSQKPWIFIKSSRRLCLHGNISAKRFFWLDRLLVSIQARVVATVVQAEATFAWRHRNRLTSDQKNRMSYPLQSSFYPSKVWESFTTLQNLCCVLPTPLRPRKLRSLLVTLSFSLRQATTSSRQAIDRQSVRSSTCEVKTY